ncbi:unnamed protein product [Brassica oleracea]
MDFDLPSYHQNTHMNITVLVVDDDRISLSTISNMLKTPTYIDKSFREITVMTANDSSEALSTLRGHCNNIDVVITEYHMPNLNGVQLQRRINEEFGNMPVIVISSDMNNEIEQETLSSGAMCFMRKPIKPNDIDTIYKHALDYKINGGSKEIQKTNSTSNPEDGSSGAKATKKFKIIWTSSLENHFCKAIQHIGVHKVTPTKILKFMNLNYLTRAHIASKLQKYRKFLKKVKGESVEKTRRVMISNIQSSSYINPQRSYNYKTSLGNNNIFNSQRGYGLGQSSHTMNNNAGFHGSVHCMNRTPTYNSQTGSKFLPRRGSLGVSSGMFALKEEMGSMSGTSQEYQAHKFGQYGTTSGVLGMKSNLNTGTTGSNYAGHRIDEKGDVFGPGGIRVLNVNENASLGRMRVTGNGNGSLGGIRIHATGNGCFGGTRVQGNSNGFLGEIKVHGIGNGSLGGTEVRGNDNGFLNERRVRGTGNGSLGGTRIQGNDNGFLDEIRVHGNHNGSFGEIRVHGNDSFGGLRVNSTDNGNGCLDGVMIHGNINANGSLGGMRVHTGNGNASLDENLSSMNWNFNNNNMSNHGSSTSRFPSALSSFFDNKDQSQNYLNAQTGGVVPVLQNPRRPNNHHGINDFFRDTVNSQFDHNQQQGKVTGENPEVPPAYPLENLSNGNYNEETLNSVANSEMYFPTDQNMIITNKEYGVEDLMELPLFVRSGL